MARAFAPGLSSPISGWYFLISLGLLFMKGKAALVTGSSNGLGLAMAEGLARSGCNVVLHGLEAPESVRESLGRIEQDYGVKAAYVQADLTDPGAVSRLVNTARERMGGIHMCDMKSRK
jgi:3-hydroxybutyrate dehydrogenase